MNGLSCAGKGPAAPINYALVMDPISRLPEIYFIKNHSRGIGHRIGDSEPGAPRLEWGEESKRPGTTWVREGRRKKGEAGRRSPGGERRESKELAEK